MGLNDPRLTGTGPAGDTTGSSPSFISRVAKPSITHAPGHEALQALLAFSSLHEQIRKRRASERLGGKPNSSDVWELEQFVLDEVLQLVSERALTLTGADGIAIALADGNAFICRASSGSIAPEPGARLDPSSGFSGACLRTGGIVRCDDSESDPRVNVEVCRLLGTRSLVAVPIASSRGTIGLLEAFSAEPYGFNDSDVRSLNLLAELILAAMRPEEENRLAEISTRLVGADHRDTAHSPVRLGSTEFSMDENNLRSVHESTPEMPVSAAPEQLPEISATIFQEYEKTEKTKSRRRLMFLLLLLVLAAASLAAWWWKNHHASPSPAVYRSAQTQEQAVPVPPAGINDQDAGSSLDTKRPLQQLVTGIWHVSSANSNTVVIDLQGEVQYEAHRLKDPERIYFDLHGTALAPGLFGKTIEVGDSLLARVRIAQPKKGVSRVVLETNGPSDFSVSMQSNPYRLVVEIRKAADKNLASSAVYENDTEAGDVTLSDDSALNSDLQRKDLHHNDLTTPVTSQTMAISASPGRVGSKAEAQLTSQVAKFRLVLDAGHGGWDLGTIGRKGLMEKDLVLDIVSRLGKLVEKRLGAEVIYTRQDDTYLPLEKRTEIANLAQADMFVSVHANYSTDSSARGAETYYTNTYSSVRARTSENSSEANVAENIDWNNVDIREKVQQSHRFAVSVQQALHRALAAQIPGMRNRGVKKASYVVLTGTSMPAILAEVSFVSSPEDENILKSASYRQNIAEGLYKGIAQYAATNHHVNLASASAKP